MKTLVERLEDTKMNKYRNRKVVIDGIKFDSAKEGKRYQELLLLQKAGEIRALELQHKFPFVVNDLKVCVYIADFVYKDRNGTVYVEDVKGMRKGAAYQMFRLKAKLVHALYGITVKEV